MTTLFSGMALNAEFRLFTLVLFRLLNMALFIRAVSRLRPVPTLALVDLIISIMANPMASLMPRRLTGSKLMIVFRVGMVLGAVDPFCDLLACFDLVLVLIYSAIYTVLDSLRSCLFSDMACLGCLYCPLVTGLHLEFLL